MGRKVFISVLGTGFYETCHYVSGSFKSEEVRFIQEAALLQVGAKNWEAEDTALVLLTSEARKKNWTGTIISKHNFRSGQIEPYEGLEKRMKDMALKFDVQDLDIPDGGNEDEMWTIFDTLFENIEDGDELYFDLTHSFRYLPMLVLVFGSYAKFLKNVTIKQISYGNWEARDKTTNEAPIIDLLPIAALQDWTFASANYLKNGKIDQLKELSKTTLSPILRAAKGSDANASALNRFIDRLESVIDERLTCRGIGIIESNNIKILKELSLQIEDTVIKPLRPVFDRIKSSLNQFDENENVMNGFSVAQWCLENGLYQQAITIAYENMFTYICIRHGFDWRSKIDRDIVSSSFKIVSDDIKEERWKLPLKDGDDESVAQRYRSMIREVKEDVLVGSFITIYNKMNAVRNDFNHAGMNDKPAPSKRIKNTISELIAELQMKVNSEVYGVAVEENELC